MVLREAGLEDTVILSSIGIVVDGQVSEALYIISTIHPVLAILLFFCDCRDSNFDPFPLLAYYIIISIDEGMSVGMYMLELRKWPELSGIASRLAAG